MRPSIIAIAAAAIALIVVVVYETQKPSPETPLLAATPVEAADAIPTPQYLFEHPDTLKQAEQKCRDNSNPSSLFCSNVHRAESLRMADQYRRSLKPKGVGQ